MALCHPVCQSTDVELSFRSGEVSGSAWDGDYSGGILLVVGCGSCGVVYALS